MADFPALPLFTDAYIADTAGLTNEEHGVYLRLLMFAWRSPDCALPDDDRRLSIMVGVTEGKWQKLKPVVMAFWSLANGRWKQKKLSSVRDFVEKSRDQKSKAGKASAKAKSLKNKDEVSTAVPTGDATERQQSKSKSKSIKKEDPNGSSDLLGNLAPADPSIADRAVAMWNDLAKREQLPQVQLLTETRRKALKERLKDAGGIEGWADAIDRVAASSFLLGDNDRGWKADFDFLLQRKSFVKLMEGGYPPRAPVRRSGSAAMAELRGMMHNGK